MKQALTRLGFGFAGVITALVGLYLLVCFAVVQIPEYQSAHEYRGGTPVASAIAAILFGIVMASCFAFVSYWLFRRAFRRSVNA